jgi:hypothetical protein
MTAESQGTTEIVPKSWQPEEVQVMNQALGTIEAKVFDFRRYVETHEVKDAESCREMKEKLVAVKALKKDAEVAAHPLKALIKKASEYVQTHFLVANNAAEVVIGMATGKIEPWEKAEERRTALEKKQKQDDLNKQREQEAEAQRKKDADAAADRKKARITEIRQLLKDKVITKRQSEKMLRLAGADEEADLAAAAADAEEHVATTPEVTVESNKPRVSGTVSRKNYSAKCLDRRVFLAAFLPRWADKKTTETIAVTRADGKIERIPIDWLDYIDVSDQALSKTAREVKDVEAMERTFPGIKAEESRSY